MSKITEIKVLKVQIMLECDCGEKFRWIETRKGAISDKCPKCGTQYGLVFAPKKINVPATKVDDFFKNSCGGYV